MWVPLPPHVAFSANLGREEKLAGRLQVSASSNYHDFLSPRSPAIQPERNSTGQHTLQLLYKLIITYTTKQKHNPPPKTKQLDGTRVSYLRRGF